MEPINGQKQQLSLTETQLKHLFMRCADGYLTRCEDKQFEICDSKLINSLFLYFIGSPNSPYDLRKGLWLDGAIGVGKTTLMNVFREFMMTFRKGFLLNTATNICNDYSVTGNLDIYINNISGYSGRPITICIDELGREQIPATYFGNKLNVMQHILHQRYGLWQSKGVITHVTTNLTWTKTLDRYEEFILDRCRQMFNMITVEGKSKRK